jgi:raffinose/stachyose/melibiose transport system substrate-binding protein
MRKQFVAIAAMSALAVGGLAACSGSDTQSGDGSAGDGSVYFLNFKPEVDQQWQQLATDYTAETGVPVKVVTAASGTYEQTLTSEMAKSSPPTIFQVNGPVGYANWKDYTADMADSQLYSHLNDQSLALKGSDGGIYGVPYAVEGFGIIYNEAIMSKYFALADKAVSIGSADEIMSFDTLKQVAEDMTAHKADLGITGVFSNTSLKPGEDWRWQTHLMNVPLYYEFKDKDYNISDGTPADIEFKYAPEYENLFNLYINNSTVSPGELGSKTVDQSMAEFALGQSAMVQNGNWAWNSIASVSGNTVKAEDIRFLPMYTGVTGEENQGLCIGTENYVSINSQVSTADQKASQDFLWWVFSSEKGKQFVTDEFGFIAPFDTFGEADVPDDPLAVEVNQWQNKTTVTNLPWDFVVMPSQQWKDDFGGQLLQYAQGKVTWDALTSYVVEDWKTQAAAAAVS